MLGKKSEDCRDLRTEWDLHKEISAGSSWEVPRNEIKKIAGSENSSDSRCYRLLEMPERPRSSDLGHLTVKSPALRVPRTTLQRGRVSVHANTFQHTSPLLKPAWDGHDVARDRSGSANTGELVRAQTLPRSPSGCESMSQQVTVFFKALRASGLNVHERGEEKKKTTTHTRSEANNHVNKALS